MDTNGNGGKRILPKLRDIIRRQRQDSDGGGGGDSPDLDFIYDDCDTAANEIAELYSYTEQPELQLNVRAFEDQMEQYQLPPNWQRLESSQRRSVVQKLLDQLECSHKGMRMRAARCLLYIAQGCWIEMQSDAEQQEFGRANCMLLYELGVFGAFTDLLNIEIENNAAALVAIRKISVSLADSQDLRVILSVLYTITEVMRAEKCSMAAADVVVDTTDGGGSTSSNSSSSDCIDETTGAPLLLCPPYREQVEAFCHEISFSSAAEELLVIKLLGMVTRFCSGAAPHFPMKKVLLLLWKLILVSLGGMETLKEVKAQKRAEASLPTLNEDTLDVSRTMRASSPPASATDLIETQNQKRNARPINRRGGLMKQSSLDDHESLSMELGMVSGAGGAGECGGNDGDSTDTDLAEMQMQAVFQQETDMDGAAAAAGATRGECGGNEERSSSPPPPGRPDTPTPGPGGGPGAAPKDPPLPTPAPPRSLPWKPKVRQKDIDFFLESARLKFVGYTVQGTQADSPSFSTVLAGLPQPIQDGVRTLRRHQYTSLAELQVAGEEALARRPLSLCEPPVAPDPAELLYQAMLPQLPQYMIALLKVLLAAAPTSKAKTDSINIMADVLPEEMPMTVLQSMKLGIDVNRHKEIIVKAVSAILLLLLKHFKLNHIYQFEFMSQHLVFANCIPLVLKFFNQNIMTYVSAKNMIPILDFPSCVIGDQPELTAESLEIGDAAPYSWRNIYSCINLLRILNKLTKWKHSRIMMLVVFKSAPILKRTLKVRHAMTQLYVLKLLKMQTKYLGRQWRKSNMKTISAIYAKVRHRLNDDWAFGNDLDARPWDFQAEECALRRSVDRFNIRRYMSGVGVGAQQQQSQQPQQQQQQMDYEPLDTCLTSVLGVEHDLSDTFKRHYSLWLEQEVYNVTIEWDQLLYRGGAAPAPAPAPAPTTTTC